MNIIMKKNFTFIAAILAILVFGFVLSRSLYYFPSDEVPLPPKVAEKLVAKVPPEIKSTAEMRLVIPNIDVDAKIGEVGITKKGNMAAPRVFREVGWYKYGTFPGKIGSAVIAGHVDNGLALPAVFKHLEDLEVGDDIYVQIEEGKRLHFVVIGEKVYDFDATPESVKEVFTERDRKLLRLITCTGNWLKEFRTHDKRLVISAVLVE